MKLARLTMVGLIVAVLMPVHAGADERKKPWWDWLDELSGPGRFSGLFMEARLFCFGETVLRETDATEVRTLIDNAGTATVDLINALPQGVVTPPVIELAEHARALLRSGTFVDMDQLSSRARVAAHQIHAICPNEKCDKTAAQLAAIRKAAVAWADVSRASQPFRTNQRLVGSGLGGFMLSACSPDGRKQRATSVDLGFRWMKAQGDTEAGERWAGGNPIRLVTLVPSVTWRLFPTRPRADFLTIGVGAGAYWFSTEGDLPGGFRSFSGTIVEPFKFTAHVPEDLFSFPGHEILAAIKFRAGLVVFPSGFPPNAFGPDLIGAKSKQLPAEWVKYWGFLIDADPLVRGIAGAMRR